MRFSRILMSLFLVALPGLVAAKSLYVLPNTPYIQAYEILGSSPYLTYQEEGTYAGAPGDAVGIAIDGNSAKLFLTFEGRNQVQVVDAITFSDLGLTPAAGASNLAGIVFDPRVNRVYTIDRNTANLYVYDWNSGASTLSAVAGSPFTLAGGTTAFGLALDEVQDRLYVAGNSTTVRYYETSTFTETGSVTLTQNAIGIAVDQVRNFLYTGNGPFGGCDTRLVKYDVGAVTETSVDIAASMGGSAGECVVGVAVDEVTGQVNITTGDVANDRLMVFSSDLVQLQAFDEATISSFGGGNNWAEPKGVAIPRESITFGEPLDTAPVPTLSEWGLILLALLLAGFGVFSIRRPAA